jgi:alpha-L-fucosidase
MTWKSVPQLLNMLISGVSMNGNLLLNVGPTARGEFDARAQDRLEGIGRWMHHHRRAILGCGPCPKELSPQPPRDCRYTYNPETKRLYVHLLAWPFRHLHLPNLGGGKVRYAQLLHDASEVTFTDYGEGHNVMANLPVVKPNVDVPVVEFFCE